MARKSRSTTSGALLTVTDIDDVAVRISEMWTNYNYNRRSALALGEEARQFVFGTDIDATSASILTHKNRTHQPKLTQLSDTLQSQYFEASLSMPDFFKFDGAEPDDTDKADKVEAWVRTKLEQKKFRETVGRQLIADYTLYGNCFAMVDYVVEKDSAGEVTYKGPLISRVSPLDIVFNPKAESFSRSPKIQRRVMHIAEIAEFPERYPFAGFAIDKINKALLARNGELVDDWIEVIKDRGVDMDGYGGYDQYFKQDMAEILIYRGDIFDPVTGRAQRNRVVYILDRLHVIYNQPSKAPSGFDGIHHAGWRIRNDNLWAQGPLDNLVGMQYRIDHLENLKADVFDLIAHPVLKIKGDDVQEPEEGYAPGAAYYMGMDSDVEFLVPDAHALNADTQIKEYHRLMEEFAGAPPESRGVRTPGEKTAFEVNKLDQNATMMFVDKARNFERMLETLLRETFEIMLVNFDGSDFIEIFDDIQGKEMLFELSQEEVQARGEFTATGARYWTRRNRESLELKEFMMGPMQDPCIRRHVAGQALADFWGKKLNLKNENIIVPFAGVKEDVYAQAIAQAESQRFQQEAGPMQVGSANSPSSPQPVQPDQGSTGPAGIPA